MENQSEKNIEQEMEAGIPVKCWWRINTGSCLMEGTMGAEWALKT